MFRRVSVVPLVPLVPLGPRVSVHRIKGGSGSISIYKVGSTKLPTIKEHEPFETSETMKIFEYPDLEHATAPPASWYFYVYPTEVITKAETLLVATWSYLSVEHQKFFLDIYLNHYTNELYTL